MKHAKAAKAYSFAKKLCKSKWRMSGTVDESKPFNPKHIISFRKNALSAFEKFVKLMSVPKSEAEVESKRQLHSSILGP